MKYKINIFIFFMIIFSISVLNMLSPKNKEVSAVENRALAKKPEISLDTILSGKFSVDFENYFADHFLNRESLVASSKFLSSLKGIKRAQEVALVDFKGQNAGGDTADNNKDNTNTKGNLLMLNDKVMEIYKFNQDKSKLYADMVNTVSDKMGSEVKVYSLLAPIQIEFLKEKKYKELSDSQIDSISYVKSNLSDKVTAVDAYHPIQEHIDEYVYFRTDHHWTALGAYYGYTGFAKAAGLTPVPLNNYTKGEAPGFLGHISTVNPSDTVNNNPDNVIFYNPPVKSSLEVFFYDKETGDKKSYTGAVISKTYIDKPQKYGVFLGGDFPLGIIKTNSKSDKKIMVIKDSYGNAFIPFLLPHYSEIYVIDPRHYKESLTSLVKDNHIDEVLILNYILTTNFENYMSSVLNLLN